MAQDEVRETGQKPAFSTRAMRRAKTMALSDLLRRLQQSGVDRNVLGNVTSLRPALAKLIGEKKSAEKEKR